MKIAQVSPLYESVPPQSYGGTERIVSYLTESLVRLGHNVTLFASGDSRTTAELVPIVPRALRLAQNPASPVIYHTLELAQVAHRAEQFDIVHFHTDYLHFPLWRKMQTPAVTTLHGRLDLPGIQELFVEFTDVPVISISHAQLASLPQAGWIGTVYNGVPEETYTFQHRSGDYLAFVGRMSPEKGARRAIEIAQRCNLPLKLAAKIDAHDEEYFENEIQPLLNDSIEYIGEVDEQDKNRLFGSALATLFPIDWPEPFGLVMIESMACGTPVVAWRNGSVPEVMQDGVTGYIVDNLDDAVRAVRQIDQIRREDCRQHFVQNFTAQRMAETYVAAYHEAIANATIARSSFSGLFESPMPLTPSPLTTEETAM